jgi:hypothetical protein
MLFYFLTYSLLNSDYELQKEHSSILRISFNLLEIICYEIILNDPYEICKRFFMTKYFRLSFERVISCYLFDKVKVKQVIVMNNSLKFVFVECCLF